MMNMSIYVLSLMPQMIIMIFKLKYFIEIIILIIFNHIKLFINILIIFKFF